MLSNFLQLHVLQPSTISSNNKPTLSNNIYLNSIEHEILSGTLVLKISDHLPNVIFCNNITLKSRCKNRGFYHDCGNFEKESYIHDLRKSKLDECLILIDG